MSTAADLNAKFAIRDHVSFHDRLDDVGHPTGLVEARIVTAAAEATVLTQGAHLVRWAPTGQQPVIYLSPKSNFAPGRPVRGGIPVLFPWFADGWDHQHKPMHGFARVSDWTVESTHLGPRGEVHLTLSLQPTDDFRAAGYGSFHAAIQFRIGIAEGSFNDGKAVVHSNTLDTTLEITNHSTEPMVFEEGLHTYFAVGDIHQVATEGLEGTTYIDKRDNFVRKVQREHLLRYTRDVDQVHVQTTAPLTIHDAAWKRAIHIHKQGSNTTVTWNPWSTTSPTLVDLAPDAWQHFVCVETVNAGDDRITLAPGHTHRMDSLLSVSAAG